jgi:teichuronic acid biosynthesis glycosyltransferase TuaC
MEREDANADVLFVTNTWPHPGEPRYGIFAKRQIESLIDAGLRCDVMFVRGFESPLAYAAAGARLLRLSLRRRGRYRLVHGHGGETLSCCLLFFGGRRVMTFCGDDLLGTPGADGALLRRSLLKRAVLRQLSRLTTATITKSREMESVLPPSVRRRNLVLPNGVNRDLFRVMHRADARMALGWPLDENVALYAGDPKLPRKRYPLAMAACERACASGTPVRLHVCHTTPPSLMPTVMNAADCLLLTSALEGSANVVKEAVTVGLPVIATPAGDVREVLEHVHPSYISEPDAETLANALVACMHNGGRSNGRDHSQWIDQRQIARRLLGLYDAIG